MADEDLQDLVATTPTPFATLPNIAHQDNTTTEQRTDNASLAMLRAPTEPLALRHQSYVPQSTALAGMGRQYLQSRQQLGQPYQYGHSQQFRPPSQPYAYSQPFASARSQHRANYQTQPQYHHHFLPNAGMTRRYPQQPRSVGARYLSQTVTPGDYMEPQQGYHNPRSGSSPHFPVQQPFIERPEVALPDIEQADPYAHGANVGIDFDTLDRDVEPRVPENEQVMADCMQFVEDFNVHFAGDVAATASFAEFCKRYNQQLIPLVDFYIGVYKILYCGRALRLLPRFMAFFPAHWKAEDMLGVNAQAELEIKRAAQGETYDNVEDPEQAHAEKLNPARLSNPTQPYALAPFGDGEAAQQSDQPSLAERVSTSVKQEQAELKPANTSIEVRPPVKERKKRPTNGFTTDQYTNVEKVKIKPKPQRVVAGADGLRAIAPALAPLAQADPMPLDKPACPAKKFTEPTAAASRKRRRVTDEDAAASNVDEEVPAKQAYSKSGAVKAETKSKKTPAVKKKKKTTGPAVKSGSLVKYDPTGAQKVDYTKLFASEVEHFGDVYPNKRAILSRASRPYVHAACGNRYTHPEDVRSHHRERCAGKESGNIHGWDDHPSCHVKYGILHTARCKDGFILLDQESLNMVENAIREGLRGTSQEPEGDDDEEETEEEDDDEV